MVEAQCQRFEVRSTDGERVLFAADEQEISIGTEKLRVTGEEGVVFSHSVETSHVRAEPFQDLRPKSHSFQAAFSTLMWPQEVVRTRERRASSGNLPLSKKQRLPLMPKWLRLTGKRQKATKLEFPTRTLTLEAPRGVEVNAGVGDFTAYCRKDLLLQSSEGELLSIDLSLSLSLLIFLDANAIRLGNIPLGSAVDPLEGAPAGTTYTKQTVYELCACANGKLYLSPAEKGSTCQTTSNFCLWS
ncbi:unnamed protein product [Tetraodon nigroviridis]|uniref:(spotted green pufferfish) hypothetical protein n=1 Tax=Tetraodon nigroviridis TaxID=99883 RepID=Q4RJA0_TETNG|nr:unnamed protein product [Tetraodon nigroviridis]